MSADGDRPTGTDGHREVDDTPMSGLAVLAVLAMIGIACIAGYFFVLKMIDVSRQEDCVLAGRRNCVAPIELPSGR